MAEALVSIVVEAVGQKLIEVAGQQLSLFAGATRELENLSSRFESIKAVLDDAESRQVGEKRVQLWLSRLRQAAYDFEDLVMDASNHAASRYNVPRRIKDRYNVAHYIKGIKERLDQIDADRNSYGFISYSPGGGDDGTLVRSQRNQGGVKRLTTGFIDESEMFIGRENDKETMISKLVSESSHEDPRRVQAVAVVGHGGLGKTTLARQIYNDGRVSDHFNTALYWVCVSDVFDVERLTKEILEQVKKPSTPPLGLHALQKELLEALEGKRFLLVLDDVWNEDEEEWKKLRLPLNSGAQGSRILITTRSQKVAETMNATHIYYLKGLSNGDSWELFKVSAFAGKKPEECLKFKNVGREIVNNCNGVPLSIKVIGSAMRSKKTVEDWQNVLNSKIWSLQQARDEILPALLLTYCHLPSYLKQCFAYCSVFPKDWEFQNDVLVRLWVAQGFIQSEGNREKEDIGDEYFDELVSRSMFQEVKENKEGRIICKMHDLLHDLAELIAKDEIYTFISKSKGGKSEECPSNSSNVRHAFLSLADSDTNILVTARRAKKLRTLWFGRTTRLDRTVDGGINSIVDDLIHQARFLRALYFPSSTRFPKSIGKLKHLTYLCLPHSKIVKLPNAIGKMQQLRYLDLSWSAIVELPESVSDLRSLHTLNLWFCQNLKKLPKDIGRMVCLRHLQIEDTHKLDYLPKGLGRLSCLRSLCDFIVGGGDEGRGCGIGELQQLNSLQGSLRIKHLERVSSREEAEKAQLWKKQHLRHLALRMSAGRYEDVEIERIDGVLEGLRPQENLEKLELYGCTGSKLPSWMDEMRCFSKLTLDSGPRLERVPHLLSLKEFHICRVRNEELPDEGWEHLVALQELIILQCMELKCLPEGLTQLPSLENLNISACNRLESLPQSLGQLKKLKSLHVSNLVTRCLPDSVGQLESLEHLSISGCLELESLPGSLGQLKKLKSLGVGRLEVLRCLPDSLGQLESLESLHVSLCKKLESLPVSLGQLKKLKELYVSILEVLRCLPDSVGQLESLKRLGIWSSEKLESLPDSLGQLKALNELRIGYCKALASLPQGLRHLSLLQALEIHGCPLLMERCKREGGVDWPNISHIPNIKVNGEWIQGTYNPR